MSKMSELDADRQQIERLTDVIRPPTFAESKRAGGAEWTERGSGFELETGAMRLAVTNQSDRGCGWCWHVSAEHAYGSDALGQGGYLSSADEAKRTACSWARTFCEKTLAAIAGGTAADKVDLWAAWHPVKGFGQTPNPCFDIDDAINDAKCNTILDDSPEWKAVRVQLRRAVAS